MKSPSPPYRDLVLVGGGHSHALFLRSLIMNPIAGLRVALVSDSPHAPYSGMLPGFLAGIYNFSECHIDLGLLSSRAGAAFIDGRVIGIDLEGKKVLIDDYPALEFDLLSLNTGSATMVPEEWAQYGKPVKPIDLFLSEWRPLQEALSKGERRKVVFIGGGAAGSELAISLKHSFPQAEVRIVERNDSLLSGMSRRAQVIYTSELQKKGVELSLSADLQEIEEGKLHLKSQESIPFDSLFFTSGSAPPDWIASLSFKKDERGFLLVHPTLQLLNRPEIFAAGDLATVAGEPRAKSGVYAVRHGEVLSENIRRYHFSQKLKEYRPQKRWLSILSLPRRNRWSGVASWNGFGFSGRHFWRLKQHLDHSFMEKFQKFSDHRTVPSAGGSPEELKRYERLCLGCGGKVPAQLLSDALPPSALGVDVSELREDPSIIQSLDALTPIVSDPHLLGRLAVVHACSDLYAGGGRPGSTLCCLGVPPGARTLQARTVKLVMEGVKEELSQCGAELSGGHTFESSQLQVILTVTGKRIHQPESIPLSREVYDLFLTKPLGSGVLFAGVMAGETESRWISEAIPYLLRTNEKAADVFYGSGASCITDVTGFGLLNHLLLSLGGEAGKLTINVSSLPLMCGAAMLLKKGIQSTLWKENFEAARGRADLSPWKTVEASILFDPQTSGGLAGLVPSSRSPAVQEELKEEAVLIGRFEPGGGGVSVAFVS